MPLPHGERLYSRQKLDVMTHYLISGVVKFVFEPEPHVSKTFELSVIDESINGRVRGCRALPSLMGNFSAFLRLSVSVLHRMVVHC